MTSSERHEAVSLLNDFLEALSSYAASRNPDARSFINRNMQRVHSLARATGTLKFMTIAPPPAVGGVVHKRVDVLQNIFSDFYGLSIIPQAIDCVESTIGVLESGQPLPGAVNSDGLPSPRSASPGSDLERALFRQYTGVMGAKVFWLAAFTLVPLLIKLKSDLFGLSFSVASLIYLTYHGLGIYIWAHLKQVRSQPGAYSATERANTLRALSKINRVVAPLSWIVIFLLILTFLAKSEFRFGNESRSLPLPDVAYDFLGVDRR